MLVDTVSGPVSIPDYTPQSYIDQIVAAAGGTAPVPVTQGPSSSSPDLPQDTSGHYADTVTGPVWITEALPQWAKDDLIAQAGGLAPPSQQAIPPVPQPGAPGPAVQAPIGTPQGPYGGPTVTPPPGSSQPTPGGALSRGVLEGTFTTPPGGLPLNVDFTAMAQRFSDALHPTAPGEPVELEAMFTALDGMGAQLGFADQGEWNTITSWLRKVFTLETQLPRAAVAATRNRVEVIQEGQANGAGLLEAALAAGAGAFPDFARYAKEGATTLNLEGINRTMLSLFRDARERGLAALDEGDLQEPAAAEARALHVLEIALGAGFTAHAAAIGLELLEPLKNMGFGQLVAPITDVAAFGPVVHALWSSAVEASVDRPLRASYNVRYPTADVGIIDVLNFGRRHEYDSDVAVGPLRVPAGFVDGLAKHGFSQPIIEAFWSHVGNPPRLYDIVRLADVLLETGPPPPELVPLLLHEGTDPSDPLWFTDYQLRQGGIGTSMLPLYKRAVVHRSTQADRNALRAENKNELLGGYITADVYRSRERDLGERDEVIELNVTAALQQRGRVYWQELEAQWKRGYQAGSISADDLRTNLAAFITDELELNLKVAVEVLKYETTTRAKVATAEERAVGAAQRILVTAYKDQYRNGLIDELTLEADVIAAGFSAAYAQAVAYSESIVIQVAQSKQHDAAVAREDARVTELLAQAYETQFTDGQLNDAQLTADFIAAGMDPRVASARTAKAWARSVATARKDAKTQLEREQRVQGQAEHQAQVAATRDAERRATELQNAYLAHMRALHRAKQITSDQLYAALVDAGWTAALAAELTATAAAQLKEDPWTPGPLDVAGAVAPQA